MRRATNRTIFVAGRGRCVRHDGWPKCFSRRGRRGGMARRVADRTLRSDVTGGRPRAVVLAIVRRCSCDCALRLMLEDGTKRTNRKRAPRPNEQGRVLWDAGREHNRALTHTGKGARFGTGAAAGLFLRRGWGGASGRVLPNFCAVGRIVRGNVTGGAMGERRAANRSILRRGRGAVWLPYGARFGGLRSPAAWRGRAVGPNLGAAGRIFCGSAAGGAMGARRAVCD